jgi:diguanylate cyclase (GGDEF)-like protein
VLALYAGESGFFDEAELRLLEELAGDIAFALDHIHKAVRADYLAYYDPLTGLANRTLFIERLSQFMRAAQAAQEQIVLVLMDIERLATLNDSLGRHAGDALLKLLSERLGRAVGNPQSARVAGDVFALMLQGAKDRPGLEDTLAQMWGEIFGAPFDIGDSELSISAKAGLAVFPADGVDAETLLSCAEVALRKAKETGEPRVFHAPEMAARSAEKRTLEIRLRRALEKEEFVLHYQPKVDLQTQRIVGAEALLRWQSPELGLVPPMKFIPLLEETGLILEVGAWVLSKAAFDHHQWLQSGIAAPRVAVNVSSVQMRKRDFVATVIAALTGGAVPPGIDLEITESLLMEEIDENIRKLRELRERGIMAAIDDFGTGYSSLSYLAKLPVQALKIDRSFILAMSDDPDTMTLVQTIISLAHSLSLKVIAEGVESAEQSKLLRLLRCDEIQGYVFSRPVPFEQMTALLTGGSALAEAPPSAD